MTIVFLLKIVGIPHFHKDGRKIKIIKNLLIIVFVVVLFAQEVLIFKKKLNMLVEKVGENSSKIIDNFKK